MPPHLHPNRSGLGEVVLYADQDTPLPLRIDKSKKILVRWAPNEPGDTGIREWTWANGPGGAGTTIETPRSYQDGSSDFGINCWLRRLGVAQPAGKVTEIPLPTGTAAVNSGQIWHGMVFGTHLWITTNTRYAIRVPYATGTNGITEQDFGVGAFTSGIKIFNGTGSARLYIGDPLNGIWEYDGTSWTEGASGTERTLLATPHWVLGDALSTGGSAGASGAPAHRLVGSNASGTGFYHVAGDPKVSANWSSLTTVGVGGAQYQIRSLAESNHEVFFGTGLGMHAVNGQGYSPNLTKWVESIAWSQNATSAVLWADLIWFTTRQGLAVFDPTGRRVDLAKTIQFGVRSGVSEIFGYIQALAPSEDGLYVGMYNSVTNDSYVGCLLLDEDGGFRWSMAEAYLPDVAVTYIQQVTDSSGLPHLFIGARESNGRLRLYVQDLPVSGDPETDFKSGSTSFRAAEDWSVQLSRFNGGRSVMKKYDRWSVEADTLGDDYPGNTVEFQVAQDGGAFVVQGTATSSPRWNSAPAPGSTLAANTQIKLAVHNAPDAPVVVNTVSARYTPRPELTRYTTYPVIIAKEITGQDPAAVLARLRIAPKDEEPITTIDHLGTSIEASVEPTPLTEVHEYEAEGKGMVVRVDVTISTSQVSAVFDEATFDLDQFS